MFTTDFDSCFSFIFGSLLLILQQDNERFQQYTTERERERCVREGWELTQAGLEPGPGEKATGKGKVWRNMETGQGETQTD